MLMKPYEDRTVKLYKDNMSVVGTVRKMSSKCPEMIK